MAVTSRPIAAFRQRLLSSAEFAAFVNFLPDGSVDPQGGRIYPRHLIDVRQPVYPCVTLYVERGRQGVWAPRIYDPGFMLVQFYSQDDQGETMEMYDVASQLLHNQKTLLSTSDFCCHEVREVMADSGVWLEASSAWQVSARYLFRGSVLT
jgi:hypothetical protein